MSSIHDPRYVRTVHRLRAVRETLGLDQTEVAARVGRSQQWLSKVEQGERRLDLLEFVDLCHALDVPARDFLPPVAPKSHGPA